MEVKYPNLAGEMAKNGENQTTLAELLGLSKPTISRKLSGQTDWTIGEVEKLCEHYGKDYYQLFIKRK